MKLALRAALVATAVFVGGCASGDKQDTLSPEGPYARKLDKLWDTVFPISVVVFFLVIGLVGYCAIRFRRRGDDDQPKQIHGNTRLELGWTIVPAMLLAFVGFSTVGTIVDLAKEPKGDVLQVQVVGHQWWWEYRYPGAGVVTANELVVPVDRPVRVSLSSVDVVHNFWAPKLFGKVYAIPGRVNKLTFQADRAGVYYGQCAEFCGLSHANMRLQVKVLGAADFDEWLTDQRKAETAIVGFQASQGRELFATKGCAGCHAVTGYSAGKVGPDLTHLQSRSTFAGALFDMTPQNLAKWLRNPPGQKPGALMPNLGLTEEEIERLVAYLETLK